MSLSIAGVNKDTKTKRKSWRQSWSYLLLYQIFISPQVKKSMIIRNKHGIYELSNKLPNDVRLTILEN